MYIIPETEKSAHAKSAEITHSLTSFMFFFLSFQISTSATTKRININSSQLTCGHVNVTRRRH